MIQFFKYQLERLDIVIDQAQAVEERIDDLDLLMHAFETRIQVAIRLLDTQNTEIAILNQRNNELTKEVKITKLSGQSDLKKLVEYYATVLDQ